jgi:hypothetical protein
MRQARLSRHFYNMHIQQFKIGCNRSQALAKVSAKLDTSLAAPSTQRDCHLLLSAIQKTIRKLQKEARQKRQDFLTRRVDFECGGDNEKAAKIRVRIQKAEDLRQVCRKISNVVKPNQSAGLATVLVIPVDNANPKLAKIWRKIDDLSAVVTIIQARNKQHFAQAANTPFTTGEFQAIPYSGTGSLADNILAGSYHSSDPIVQLLLDELVRPFHQAIPPIPDLLTAVSDRFKKWDESTSVSPFSNRYLTQYISLIRAIREPTKGEPPPILPPAAQELAATAKSLLSLHVRLLELSITHQHS